MCARYFILSLLFITLATVHVDAQITKSFQKAWRSFEEVYKNSMREEGVIGGSVYFSRNGKIMAKTHFGHADIETDRTVDERTIFHWASITKTFTGIAIMQLRDRGLLSLDDPVIDYIPELNQVHNPYGAMSEITLRHLMSHSAGFRASTWPWGGEESWHPHEPRQWEQLVAMLPYTNIQFEPGSRYSYSNPAIIFLGRIIELLSGDHYEVYIDKNILKPLGMYATYFDATPYHLLPYRSNNYYSVDGEIQANGLDFDTGITVSNSGLNAPLPDMLRYLTFLTDDTAPLLKRSSLEEMWQPHQEIKKTDKGVTSMGLIFFLVEHEGRRFIGHTGNQKAFISFFYVDPEAGTACIAAFNTVGRGVSAKPATVALSEKLTQLLFDSIFPLFYE